ncbi:hypothetical protein EON68_01355, partial [archaeon]
MLCGSAPSATRVCLHACVLAGVAGMSASSGVSITIPGVAANAESKVVTYTLAVEAQGVSWIVKRRFKQFAALHAQLLSVLPTDAVPELPPKQMRIGKARFDPEFIESRRSKLELFLQRVLRLIEPERLEALDNFLEYAEHCLKAVIRRLSTVPQLRHIVHMLRQAADGAAATHHRN